MGGKPDLLDFRVSQGGATKKEGSEERGSLDRAPEMFGGGGGCRGGLKKVTHRKKKEQYGG